MKIHYCKFCDLEYEAKNGNSRYCSDTCEENARSFRQGERYGGIRTLLPVLHKNHELFDQLFLNRKDSYLAEELVLEGIDFSLFRKLYPDPKQPNLIWLDFGTYYLETADNLKTFKLCKHETTTSRPK